MMSRVPTRRFLFVLAVILAGVAVAQAGPRYRARFAPSQTAVRPVQSQVAIQSQLPTSLQTPIQSQFPIRSPFSSESPAIAPPPPAPAVLPTDVAPQPGSAVAVAPAEPIVTAPPAPIAAPPASVATVPVVRPVEPPNLYGRSTVAFDNQSGQPALVRLVGPTRAEVEVANGGQNSIARVAAGSYVIRVRYGTAGDYRFCEGDAFTVTETWNSYSSIRITLHPVVNGNYGTRPISADDFGG